MSWAVPTKAVAISLVVAMILTDAAGLSADQTDGESKESLTATVSGNVTLPDNAPAVGADVHLLHRSKGSYRLPVSTQKVKTDEQGKFNFKEE